LRPTEAAWFQEPAIVRPQAEGEQQHAKGTFTGMRDEPNIFVQALTEGTGS